MAPDPPGVGVGPPPGARPRSSSLACAATLLSVSPSASQGVQTGVLTVTVRDASHLVLPGVTVTITSPVLQGARAVVTDTNGVYVFRALPPGARF
ncbi:MAG: carboxypeptidase regulatory-like domain-containing protein [Acidobacteria bacterium]|nr:MAG: carboxypeptidase regulatory-like domain-containing protein [Acidobacteriota bacterium]